MLEVQHHVVVAEGGGWDVVYTMQPHRSQQTCAVGLSDNRAFLRDAACFSRGGGFLAALPMAISHQSQPPMTNSINNAAASDLGICWRTQVVVPSGVVKNNRQSLANYSCGRVRFVVDTLVHPIITYIHDDECPTTSCVVVFRRHSTQGGSASDSERQNNKIIIPIRILRQAHHSVHLLTTLTHASHHHQRKPPTTSSCISVARESRFPAPIRYHPRNGARYAPLQRDYAAVQFAIR